MTLITNQAEAIRVALHSQRGSLGVVMLVDDTGKPVGLDSADPYARATFDALYAMARRVLAYDPEVGIDLLKVEDAVVFFDWEGRQAICKAFAADNRTWLLVALVPPEKPYKQALAKVIKALQTILTPPAPKKPRAKRTPKAETTPADSVATDKPKRTRRAKTSPPSE